MPSSQRVLFRLSMPHCGSCNGRWTGEGRNYVIVERMSARRIAELAVPRAWRYDFGDGWCASVHASIMRPREIKPKSDGFCGYEWMVRNILKWGTTQCQHEWIRDPESGTVGLEGTWRRCRFCGRRERVDEAVSREQGASHA